jgi:hypothetical protein
LNPDFDLLIKSYDVLIFTETKTDEFDELKLPEEYTYFAKHRKKKTVNCGFAFSFSAAIDLTRS